MLCGTDQPRQAAIWAGGKSGSPTPTCGQSSQDGYTSPPSIPGLAPASFFMAWDRFPLSYCGSQFFQEGPQCATEMASCLCQSKGGEQELAEGLARGSSWSRSGQAAAQGRACGVLGCGD